MNKPNSMRWYLPILLLTVLAACQTYAPVAEEEGPPSTDIWLFSISDDGFELRTRVTDWKGYDNQPMFTENSEQMLFTSDRAGRSNTHLYDIDSGSISQLTFTEADKYSPTPIPDSNGLLFSVVHSDSSAFQELWQYALDDSIEPSRIVEVDAVAYYTWVGVDEVLFWRLGEPNTLQLLNVASADTTVLAEGSVYSLHHIPGEAASAFIYSNGDETPLINRYDWVTRETTLLAPSIEGGRYFCVAPNGDLLMLDGGTLLSFTPGVSNEWTVRAELSITGGTRLAVSPDGKLLAVVGEETSEE